MSIKATSTGTTIAVTADATTVTNHQAKYLRRGESGTKESRARPGGTTRMGRRADVEQSSQRGMGQTLLMAELSRGQRNLLHSETHTERESSALDTAPTSRVGRLSKEGRDQD